MTLLTASAMPSIRINAEGTYDATDDTFISDGAGTRILNSTFTIGQGASLVVEAGAIVAGMPAGPTGAKGDQGPPGDSVKGDTGSTGPAGTPGLNGTNGVDAKRIDTYTTTTDSNGLATVAFSAAFLSTPTIHPEPPSAPAQSWIKVSSSPTGCVLRLVQRTSVTLLGAEVLLAQFVNVVGASVTLNAVAA